jgi:DNA mismatch repair protein MutS2
LRQAVHEVLAKHPLVKSFRPGDYGEGDYGVTIVELVSR